MTPILWIGSVWFLQNPLQSISKNQGYNSPPPPIPKMQSKLSVFKEDSNKKRRFVNLYKLLPVLDITVLMWVPGQPQTAILFTETRPYNNVEPLLLLFVAFWHLENANQNLGYYV
jgi:hypothetical protein